MVFALRSHFHTHPISSSFPKRQSPLLNPPFKHKPIKTLSLSPLQLNSKVYKPSYSVVSINPGGDGGGPEGPVKDGGGDGDGDGDGGRDQYRGKLAWIFIRGVELLLRSDPRNVVVVGLPETLGWLCAQAAWEMYLLMVEIMVGIERCCLFLGYACLGAVLLAFSAMIYWL